MSSRPMFEHPVCLLTQVDFYVQEQFTDRLAPLGIYPRQFGMLSLLVGNDGLAQHELAEELNIHRNIMVGLVDDLERRGLVERRRHPADRRAYALHVLPAGRALHAEAEALLDEFEAELLGGLEVDEAKSFLTTLQRITEQAGMRAGVHPGLKG